MASARVNYLASTAIHDAIGKGLGEGVYGYDSLIAFEKDSAGRITALKTDMLAVNRMKSYITGNVLEAIKNIGTSELGIPFGNLIGGELFSGRGPHIPVRIVPVGSVNAEFSNVFSSAGINQTRHQIMMTVNADLSILTLGDSEETRVSVQVSVAETVIVGSVPDSYANLDIPLN
jgi:sporulation protein YunB